MKVLVAGAGGQLGWELMRRLDNKTLKPVGYDLPDFNIIDRERVFSVIELEKPDFVVNASAYTLVDKAETEKDTAYKVNRDGPLSLAQVCSVYGIPMIHLSTDYVFDGTKGEPYRESDPTAPLGVYGMSKAAGEMAVRKNWQNHVIVRTSWLYGVHGGNFVKTMIRLAEEKEVIRVVNDQFGCPTFAGDLADAIGVVIDTIIKGDRTVWGTYHYCGKGVATWYDFACEIIARIQMDRQLSVKQILPIPGSEYPTPAKRPSYSVLDCRLMESQFNIKIKAWRDSLGAMLGEMRS